MPRTQCQPQGTQSGFPGTQRGGPPVTVVDNKLLFIDIYYYYRFLYTLLCVTSDKRLLLHSYGAEVKFLCSEYMLFVINSLHLGTESRIGPGRLVLLHAACKLPLHYLGEWLLSNWSANATPLKARWGSKNVCVQQHVTLPSNTTTVLQIAKAMAH